MVATCLYRDPLGASTDRGISRQCDFGLHPAAMTRGGLRQQTLGDYLRVIRPYIESGFNPTLQRA
jgi:hypothetical protein